MKVKRRELNEKHSLLFGRIVTIA